MLKEKSVTVLPSILGLHVRNALRKKKKMKMALNKFKITNKHNLTPISRLHFMFEYYRLIYIA